MHFSISLLHTCYASSLIRYYLGCFMTTLNATFESKLTLEDEGYDSGSENFNIPTPLRRTSKIHHVSSVENASFDLHPVMPSSTGTKESNCRPVCRCLTFSSFEEGDDDTPTDEIPSPNSNHQSSITQMPSSNHLLSAP